MPRATKTSEFIGVTYERRRRQWKAQIRVHYNEYGYIQVGPYPSHLKLKTQMIYIGRFAKEIDAASAYDEFVDHTYKGTRDTNRSLGLLD